MRTDKRGRPYAIAGLLLATALALGSAFVPRTAMAVENRPGLTVHIGDGEYKEAVEGSDVVVDLYLVASSPDIGRYEFLSGYGDFKLTSETTQNDWRAFAQEAAQKGPGTAMPVSTGHRLGEKITSNTAGENLSPGIYLIVPRNEAAEAKLVEVTDDAGGKSFAFECQISEYTVRFAPELIAVPNNLDSDGVPNTAGVGWDWDVTAYLKPELEKRLGSLEIVKDLLSYETDHEAFFLFQCEGYLDGEHNYSNLVSLRFDGPGEKRTLLENIPVGTEITIREIYATPGYSIIGADSGIRTVQADEVVSIRFENDWDESRDEGGGIMNNFDYDLDRGEWSWTAD